MSRFSNWLRGLGWIPPTEFRRVDREIKAWAEEADHAGAKITITVADGRLTWAAKEAPKCRTYWGSHGCTLLRGHEGHHLCDCCECENHPDPGWGCVGAFPFYGPDTNFYTLDIPEDSTDV